jgi:hypothetical protein
MADKSAKFIVNRPGTELLIVRGGQRLDSWLHLAVSYRRR